MRKKQFLTMQAQLEERLGKRLAVLEKYQINVHDDIETLGTEFESTLRDLDAQQCCNRYVWEGLPEYLTGQMIEIMLYTRGSLCGYFNGGVLYIMPYSQTGGLNVYGMPNAVKPITYNGEQTSNTKTMGLSLPVSSLGALNTNAKACLLFDRLPALGPSSSPIGRSLLNRELVTYQCDLLGRIKNNLRNIDKKMVFYVDSDGQANQMRKDLREAYGTSDPFIVVVRKSSVNDMKGEPMQTGIDVETQSLFETWQSINSIRCMCSGITNGGAFEKKERKITGELQGDQTQTELVLDAGLRMRRLFLEQMKVIYPDKADVLGKIKVSINEQPISYEVEETDKGNEDAEREV